MSLLRNILVTFDVDGTLLGGSYAGANIAHKRAIDYAIRSVWGVDGHVDEVTHVGSTDPLIIRDVLLHHKIPVDTIWQRMPEAIQVAGGVIMDFMTGLDLRSCVLPGVHTLLSTLCERGVLTGLVTGNLEFIGWCKMEAAGLRRYFEMGAFSGDTVDRGMILENAIVAAEKIDDGERFKRITEMSDDNGNKQKCLTNVFHVGDAVSDMNAAKRVGAKGIGVLTGSFNKTQLESESPFAILDGLEDTKTFLKLIGVEES